MTDYSTKKSSKKRTWEKLEAARKWRGIFAIFIVLFLGFFIINGILRAFTIKKFIAQSRWDGNGAFVAALSTSPTAVLIFNKEIGNIVILKVGERYFSDGQKLANIISRDLGVDVGNYVVFGNRYKVDENTVGKAFSDFAGFSTPLEIIGGGGKSVIQSTNITRVDMLRLWWQAKDLGKESLKIMDLEEFSQDVIGPGGTKIKSLDRELFHSRVNKYLESKAILDESPNLEIKNSSGVAGVGQLAAEISASLGFNVLSTSTGEGEIEKCQVITPKNSYSSGHLANIFGCDIVTAPEEATEAKIILIVGQNFAQKYF